MNCDEARALVDAAVDGELDLIRHVEVETHVQGCAACARLYEARRAMQSAIRTSDLYFRAPARLQARVRQAAGSDIAGRPPVSRSAYLSLRWSAWPVMAAAVVILAVSVAGVFYARRAATDVLAQQVVASHVRSLLPGHLTDVLSSDQHTVRPWFAGKLDFSPPVVDLHDRGFPLVGGRLDYVDERVVAALVYRRNQHLVNLFVWPSSSGGAGPRQSQIHGYNLVHWNGPGVTFWLVSDLNTAELRQFAGLLQQRLGS